jgi:chromosome segregation ATPase
MKDKRYQLEAALGQSEAEIKLIGERIKNLQERLCTAGADTKKYARLLESLNQDWKSIKTTCNPNNSNGSSAIRHLRNCKWK